MTKMTKMQAYTYLVTTGDRHRFVASVLLTRSEHSSHSAKRLKAMAAYVIKGIKFDLAEFSITQLVMNGTNVPWSFLDSGPTC